MPTFTTVDATWTTSMTMDQDELKRADTAMFLGDGTNNGVRGGIVRHGDTSLAVTVNGSDQVTVQPGAFVIPAATGLGVYRGSLSAAVGPTAGTALSARNATNPRIDLVVVQISSGAAVVKTIDGTPAASPSAPALPAQHIELARVTVPQTGGGAVTVDSTFRAYATGLGGTLYVENLNRLPGSGNQKGQRAVALDTGATHEWNGTAWIQDGAWLASGALQIVNLPTHATNSVHRYYRRGSLIVGEFVFQATGAGTGTLELALPVTARSIGVTALTKSIGTVVLTDTGTTLYVGQLVLQTTSVARILAISGATLSQATTTFPFAWASGDYIGGTYQYEAA